MTKLVRNFLIWPGWNRILKFKYRRPVQLGNDLRMYAYSEDILGRLVWLEGPMNAYFWEPGATKLLEKLIRDARVSLIAGAHIGYTVLMAAKASGGNAKIYTFEPVPELYELARKNIELNSLSEKVVLTPVALSNKEGLVAMSVDGLRSSVNEGKRGEVKAVSIDSFWAENHIAKIDFMLLDVEGFEKEVFEGAKEQFAAGGPRDIIFELSPRNERELANFPWVRNFLETRGYKLHVIEDNYELEPNWKPPQPTLYKLLDVSKFLHMRYMNILATRRTDV